MRSLFLLFCFIGTNALAQLQPQFKFYLAFEDATGARDTVWYGIDENAIQNSADSIFGDTAIPFNDNLFNVFFGANDSLARKTIIDDVTKSSWSWDIFSSNGVYPITIRWDTSLLISHQLPFELRTTWLYNNYMLNQPMNLAYPPISLIPNSSYLTYYDSIILYYAWDHFPMQLKFSRNWPNAIEKLVENEQNNIVLRNPAINAVEFNADFLDEYATIYDLRGQIIWNDKIRRSTLSESGSWPSGVYFIKIGNRAYVEKFVLQQQ